MERDKLAKFSPGFHYYYYYSNLNVLLHVSIELAKSMNWKKLIFPPVLILSHWKSISLSLIETFDWVKLFQFAFVNFFNCFRPINSIVLLIEPPFIKCWRSNFSILLSPNFQQNCRKEIGPHEVSSLFTLFDYHRLITSTRTLLHIGAEVSFLFVHFCLSKF